VIALPAAMGLLSMALSAAEVGAARFEQHQCRRVALMDVDSGQSVRGAESIVLSGDGTRLFVSAYDRRAATASGIPPQGGLYLLSVADLNRDNTGEDQRLEVRSLAAGPAIAGGFRPHGLALHEAADGGRMLAVINRRYFDKQAGKRKFRPSIELFRSTDTAWRHAGTLAHPGFCRANDLAFLDDNSLIMTIDRSVCADFTVSEDVLGFAGGHLLQVDFGDDGSLTAVERPATKLLDFPNGVVTLSEDTTIYVALTKGAAIAVFRRNESRAAGPLVDAGRISLPGHPDNLSVMRDSDGRKIVAALYPDLPRFAAYRYGWFGTARAASFIVAIDEEGGVEPLVEDPGGTLFSAASSAVLIAPSQVERGRDDGDLLIAGSVGDDGLLVCSGEARR